MMEMRSIVKLSTRVATITNNDCDVESIPSRELERKSRSGCLSASSRFFEKKVKKSENNPLHLLKSMV